MSLPSDAARLNQSCFCLTLDHRSLCAALECEADDPDFCRRHVSARSNLFSNVPFFLPAESLLAMQDVVSAIHSVSLLPAYRQRVLSWAPAIARDDPGPLGAFMGFDFHLTAAGSKLIEVNTNAGGAFLNNLLAKAQIACCREMEPRAKAVLHGDFAVETVRMFEAEHRLSGASRELRRIAIVDDEPETQFLYPEFVLARQMLVKAGYDAVIASPADLRFSSGQLLHEDGVVDLVYNRLVDFALEEPEHEALRRAYEGRVVAVTPNPHNHALLADKQNLTVLSDHTMLAEMGVSRRLQDVLEAVPRTVIVGAGNAAELWWQRKSMFFRPVRGYGSKAVYRGDKVTRGVFEEIVKGDYVAQAFVPAGKRMMRIDGIAEPRKVDIRLYTFSSRTLLAAARIYQGQATNFRTPGGGFAPVFVT